LPLIYTDLCLKQVFENLTLSQNAPPCWVLNSACTGAQDKTVICFYHTQLSVAHSVCARSCSMHMLFTGVHLWALNNAHSSITTENRIHVDRKFFCDKDIGNHLQLCKRYITDELPCIYIFRHLSRKQQFFVTVLYWD
jgi:hypothetical protein